MKVDINLDCGQWHIGEYSIAGNDDDGYTIWKTADGEDSETLYADESFEKCLTWIYNSL